VFSAGYLRRIRRGGPLGRVSQAGFLPLLVADASPAQDAPVHHAGSRPTRRFCWRILERPSISLEHTSRGEFNSGTPSTIRRPAHFWSIPIGCCGSSRQDRGSIPIEAPHSGAPYSDSPTGRP
jgi:hypothetical protein